MPALLDKLVALVAADKPLTPKQLGALIDAAKQAEAERLDADKVAEWLKVTEVTYKQAIMLALKNQDIKGGAGNMFATTIKTEDQPTVKDWPLFYKYIIDNDAFDMLERRPGKAAIKARWDDGKAVPGVDKFPVDKLYFTKIKG